MAHSPSLVVAILARVAGERHYKESTPKLPAKREQEQSDKRRGEQRLQHSQQPAPSIARLVIEISRVRPVEMSLLAATEDDYYTCSINVEQIELVSAEQRDELIERLEVEMREAAKAFEFEKAAQLRDRIKALKQMEVMA